MDTKTTTTIQKSIETGIRKAFARCGAMPASDEIADLAQDTWVRALPAFDANKGEMGALAYTTAYNVAIDALRGRKPQASAPTGSDGEPMDVEAWDVSAHQESSRFARPDVALLAKERAALLVAAAERAGVTADLTALVDGSADLDNGAVRVRKHRIQKMMAEEVAE